MEVNFTNFFSHLIFHPTDAKTEKDRKIALAASIALGIFSAGLIHLVCAFVKYVAKPLLASKGKNPEIASIAKERLLHKDKSNPSQSVEREAPIQT
jgi:hypothetical protein